MLSFATTDVRLVGLDRAAALAGGALACEAGHDAEPAAPTRSVAAPAIGALLGIAVFAVAILAIL